MGSNCPVIVEKQIIGAGKRRALCYYCGSTDRERLLYVYLFDRLAIAEAGRMMILHIAPERNLFNRIRHNRNIVYICGDKRTGGYEDDYPEEVIPLDVLNLPFYDDTFDLIMCNHVLEHIPDDSSALKQLYRVLKPGGRAILQVPISKVLKDTFEDVSIETPEDREKYFGQFNHVRIYGEDYASRIVAAGFQFQRITMHSQGEYQLLGLNPDEDILIGMK